MPLQLTIEKTDGSPGSVYYPLRLHEQAKPTPGPNEYLVKIHAAALNHRDLFIRQHLYPGIAFNKPLLSDGYGAVIEAGPDADRSLLHKPVLLTPCRGWDENPDGPDDYAKFANIGATKLYDAGTAQEYILANASEVEPAPAHLSAVEGAALPLVGLTGWRALVTKSGNAVPGCHVWVTSGEESKIRRAEAMGAKGGVSYRADGWEKALLALLPDERPLLDAIIDGTGGDIVQKGAKILKPGGVIVSYGMTLGPRMDWPMQAVLKNIELRGTSAGSQAEFREMVKFVGEAKIKPVVSRVVKGLDNLGAIDGLFEDMHSGAQFGKLVIEICPEEDRQ